MMPIAIEPIGPTQPQAGVIATRPATAPEARAEHRRRAAVDPLRERPGERRGGGGEDRVGEHHGR